MELAGVADSIEEFCTRVRGGLDSATFEQKRRLVELLVDRVVVTEDEVEIRYVVPTTSESEKVRFCHLRTDYFRDPQAIHSFGGEVTLHKKIRGRRRRRRRRSAFASARWREPSFYDAHRTREQPRLPHQRSSRRFLAHLTPSILSSRSGSSEHLRSLSVCVNANDLLGKQGVVVVPSPSRRRSLCPSSHRSRSSWRPSRDPTHHVHPVVCLPCLDEGVDHLRAARRSSSLAKNVAPLFLRTHAPLFEDLHLFA
jgi:hypothetical protein